MNGNRFACGVCGVALGVLLIHECHEAIHTENATELSFVARKNQLGAEHDHKENWESPPRELRTGAGSNQAQSFGGGVPAWRYTFAFFDDEPRPI